MQGWCGAGHCPYPLLPLPILKGGDALAENPKLSAHVAASQLCTPHSP